MSSCFAFASGKGGVGKSTITANLGAALSLSGAETVVVDADIGLRSQDTFLSLENRVVYDLIDLVNGSCTLQQCLLTCDAFPRLRLLPAAQFSRAKALDPKKFSKIIGSLRDSFAYILIDCPAGIERGLRNVLKAEVDEWVLIATPDDVSLRSAERAKQIMWICPSSEKFQKMIWYTVHSSGAPFACSMTVKPGTPSCGLLPV